MEAELIADPSDDEELATAELEEDEVMDVEFIEVEEMDIVEENVLEVEQLRSTEDTKEACLSRKEVDPPYTSKGPAYDSDGVAGETDDPSGDGIKETCA